MIGGVVARLRSLWSGIRTRHTVDEQMREEFRAHIELRARDLAASGLPPDEALRRARAEFGVVEQYAEQGSAARGLAPFDAVRLSWLDLKLGWRLLGRYPGLTIVGGLAMAFAVAIGATTFEMATQWLYPKVPLPGGDRIVGVQMWDAAANRPAMRVAHDFRAWRGELRSIIGLSAFHQFKRTLAVEGRVPRPVDGAEMSASAFTLAGVRPLMGRTFDRSDEAPDALPVIVVSWDIWQRDLGGDPSAVGRTLKLGDASFTVTGIMPKGFGFPISDDVWTPLRLDAAGYAPDAGPTLGVLGRLADGVSLEQAQHELDYVGARAKADFPDTYATRAPRVLPYVRSILPVQPGEITALRSINGFVVLLAMLVCGNVALLMFARAATRENELVVRYVLGAARGRLVTQLFAEALVLGGVGAVVGVAAASYLVRIAWRVSNWNLGRLPFWIHDGLSPRTLLYSVGLAMLGALVAGVVPGLKVTRGLVDRLRQATSGGGGLHFGGLWTAVIVAQVAVTTLFPVGVFALQRLRAPVTSFDLGFSAGQYLSAALEYDGPDSAFGPALVELERRLTSEPAVAGVTLSDRLPGDYHARDRLDAIGGMPAWSDTSVNRLVWSASVAPGWFNALGAGVSRGRGFTPADVDADSHVIVVNEAFVHRVLHDGNAIGRQVRFLTIQADGQEATRGPWYEIVGVVPDLGMNYVGQTSGNGASGVYHPLRAGASPVFVAVHMRGDPAQFGPRLSSLVWAVDPLLRVRDVQPMDETNDHVLRMMGFMLRAASVVSAIALLLALAGVYSAVSFSVARKTREIGIRIALGAAAREVIVAIFRRPVMQVALGVLVGATLVGVFVHAGNGTVTAGNVVTIALYAVAMMAVCLLACVVPTWRALRVEPTEALRGEC